MNSGVGDICVCVYGILGYGSWDQYLWIVGLLGLFFGGQGSSGIEPGCGIGIPGSQKNFFFVFDCLCIGWNVWYGGGVRGHPGSIRNVGSE